MRRTGHDDGSTVEEPGLRDQVHVFRNREQAGQRLADLLRTYADTDAVVLAIPAGGVPVGDALARALHLDLDLLIVSKVTLPWTTEAGYGAVAADGTVRLNEPMLARIGLPRSEVQAGIERTRQKVERRAQELRGRRRPRPVSGRTAIVVDDGLASGLTMGVALEALGRQRAARRIVAVPTAHDLAAKRVAREADVLYCANLRSGAAYAVADAYLHWHDVTEAEVAAVMARWASEP